MTKVQEVCEELLNNNLALEAITDMLAGLNDNAMVRSTNMYHLLRIIIEDRERHLQKLANC